MALRLQLVQYPIEGELSLEAFQKKVAAYIKAASAKGVDLLIFPELFCLDLLRRAEIQEESRALSLMAKEITPPLIHWLRKEATREGMAILAGTFPFLGSAGEVTNRAYFLSPEGEHFQDKLFLTPDERAWGWKGTSVLRPFSWRGFRCQIQICYDLQFAAQSHCLAEAIPDLILGPSMTEEKGKHRVAFGAQCRAVENYCYVAVTGTSGGPKGTYRSRAAVYAPSDTGWDTPIVQADDQPEAVDALIDLNLLRERRERAGIFSARDFRQRGSALTLAPLVRITPDP
jgi:predicted amidohydrolase